MMWIEQKVFDPSSGRFKVLPLDDCDNYVIETRRLAVKYGLDAKDVVKLLRRLQRRSR